MEDRVREREAWLRGYLRLRNGIPGHDTIRCVIALNGKTPRGAARRVSGPRALRQVSACAAEREAGSVHIFMIFTTEHQSGTRDQAPSF
ncbi:MAG: hypothetical protein LBE06_07630 [Azoarcus sp.]|jgi:hypothetical protein|nr:hypothetical protein [Azoarcus sp.]